MHERARTVGLLASLTMSGANQRVHQRPDSAARLAQRMTQTHNAEAGKKRSAARTTGGFQTGSRKRATAMP
jgi:hypothetical protein